MFMNIELDKHCNNEKGFKGEIDILHLSVEYKNNLIKVDLQEDWSDIIEKDNAYDYGGIMGSIKYQPFAATKAEKNSELISEFIKNKSYELDEPEFVN